MTKSVELVAGLERVFGAMKKRHVRIASAFVKAGGVETLAEAKPRKVELLAGLDFAITDPSALELASKLGWSVRVTQSEGDNTFHPKVYWCLDGPAPFAYVGSANLTAGGVGMNRELGVRLEMSSLGTSGASRLEQLWSDWWSQGVPIQSLRWDEYRKAFEDRRQREHQARSVPRLAVPPYSAPQGECLVFWGRTLGGSHSVFQLPVRYATFFGLEQPGSVRDVWVSYGDNDYLIDVHHHIDRRRGGSKTLQLNMGRSKLHLEAEPVLIRRNLLALARDAEDPNFLHLHVIPGKSDAGVSLMRACGAGPDDFVAGIASAAAGR